MVDEFQTAAMFWDVENFGISRRRGPVASRNEKMALALFSYFEEKGIKVPTHLRHAFACAWRRRRTKAGRRKKLPRSTRCSAAQLYERIGFDLCWSDQEADDELIADIRSMLYQKEPYSLPEIVIIMSGDRDFCDLIRELRKNLRKVWVVIPAGQVARLLIESADRHIRCEDVRD